MKKAYELGVLCSVDIVVVIFAKQEIKPEGSAKKAAEDSSKDDEEVRPTSKIKCFEYCSREDGDLESVLSKRLKVLLCLRILVRMYS